MSKESLQLTLQQRLQQSLSPQQLEYARMLEMSGPEIEEQVSREVDDNPALEVADSEIPAYRLRVSNFSADDNRPEPQIADDSETLPEHLERQLGELDLTPRQRLIATYITGNLDSNGYLRRDPTELADDMSISSGIDTEAPEVRDVLAIVRSLEPAGVGAFDLRDCLVLQLDRKTRESDNPDVTLAREIVVHYFDLFSRMHYERLAQELGVTPDTLQRAVAVIRGLNPKPGSSLGQRGEQGIIPDFILETDDTTGNLDLTLLNSVPELQISESFSPGSENGMAAEAAEFIKRKRGDADSFIDLLRRRQATLYAVMRAIADIQAPFFKTENPADLKPMILKDIAAITGLDISVISRAASGKYVATPHGVYPLKLFFNERPKADAEEVSQHKVLAALSEAIENEDKRRPLSDEALTRILAGKGFDIARRTVAKYRERLGLPVARLRKTF